MAKAAAAPDIRHHFAVKWDEAQRHAKALAWRVHDKHPDAPWKIVIAVARGGATPAMIIARELGIRPMAFVSVKSYGEFAKRGEPVITCDAGADARTLMGPKGEYALIVDDLVDTGATFRALRARYPKASYVALYAKPEGESTADEYFIRVSQDTWIFLPWDLESDRMEYAPPLIGS